MSDNRINKKSHKKDDQAWSNFALTNPKDFEEVMYIMSKMAKELHDAKRYNKCFRKCLHRAQKLYYEKHPEANGIMDGAENLAWLLEQIKLLEEYMEWKPMVIAPMDGTPVLLMGDGKIYIASWQQNYYIVAHDDDPFAWCVSESSGEDQDGYVVVEHPSGWKPLPKLPKEII